MRYSKLIRFPVVVIILLSHLINPFKNFADILSRIRSELSDWEKEYIINTCLNPKIAEDMRKMIYE